MIYDTIIIGGGPAGYFAAIYCAYNGLSVAILEKLGPGGQINTSHDLDEFPGIDLVAGPNLSDRLLMLSNRFGAKTFIAEALRLEINGNLKKVHTDIGVFSGRSVVIATGTSPKKLELEGEDDLLGRGISYCAACEGGFFKGKDVVVVGGGNNAAADALHLSRLCNRVILVHEDSAMTASKVLFESINCRGNIEFMFNSNVESLIYDDELTGLKVRNKNGILSEIQCNGLFVSVGRSPNNELFRDFVDLDANGYADTCEHGITKIPGLFVTGDVRVKNYRRVLTAASDGTNVSKSVSDYIKSL